MTRFTLHAALVAAACAASASSAWTAAPEPALMGEPATASAERHHYTLSARVRPLLLFWIRSDDVGDAVVTRTTGADRSGYTLLIGSDPARTPMHINRWGYLDEELRGGEARLIGLMTEADEQSIEEAEAHVKQASGERRTYQVIHATIDGNRARSVVIPVDVPSTYSFRDVEAVLDLARRTDSHAGARDVRIPAGTQPGFLNALAGVVHDHVRTARDAGHVRRGAVVTYVYHGRLYELRATRAESLPTLRVGATTYRRVIAADFEIRNTYTGEVTPFSMAYGTEGPLAEVPITASYQPRWWMQVDLVLAPEVSRPR